MSAGGSPGDNPVLLLIIYVLLALVFSFICSVSEAVLLSVTPSYIEGLRENKPRLADLLIKLKKKNVDRSLAAILSLNTAAHTIGAIGAGAQATVVFGSAWFGVFSAVMTLLILFLSEIIPKTIGAVYWPQLLLPTAHFVNILIYVLFPFVWLSERLTRLISKGNDMHIFSREEFIAMTRVGEETGHLRGKESAIINNLLRFGHLKTSDIMTPRTVMAALPQEMSAENALDMVRDIPFSRLPVFSEEIDHITGFVLKEDLLKNPDCESLSELKRPILIVPEIVTLSFLMEMFIKKRQHIAVAVDEYGATKGIVTLEDIVETLMGTEITDETDREEDMQILAKQRWKKKAEKLNTDNDIGK